MKTGSNQVRIIGGKWRGRKLNFPNEQGLRPTSDRVRETLFNWLAPVLGGASCLDLFAGSGALGFEAASRGAAHVVMVENHPKVAAVILQNRQKLGAGDIEVVRRAADAFLGDAAAQFDVVFVDPPFGETALLDRTLEQLEASDCLKPDALIYVEAPRKTLLSGVPAGWELSREKTAGQVAYRLYCRRSTRN